MKVAQSCLTLFATTRTAHGILQARILEWVAFPFSRESPQPSDRTQVFHIGGRFFTSWATREAQEYWSGLSCPPPEDLPNRGFEPRSTTIQEDSLPSEPPEKPKYTGGCSLSLLQGIFLTQELIWGLLHCRQILYQLSSQGYMYTHIYLYNCITLLYIQNTINKLYLNKKNFLKNMWAISIIFPVI